MLEAEELVHLVQELVLKVLHGETATYTWALEHISDLSTLEHNSGVHSLDNFVWRINVFPLFPNLPLFPRKQWEFLIS